MVTDTWVYFPFKENIALGLTTMFLGCIHYLIQFSKNSSKEAINTYFAWVKN